MPAICMGIKMTILYTLIIVITVLMILYLLAIMPRLGNRKARLDFLGVYYAHRGLHNNESKAPENSLAAFKKAVEGKVCDYTFQELKEFKLCGSEERIPAFEQVLKLVGGKVPLIVELKVEWTDISVCPLADEMLRNYKGLYCIESFNPLALFWYRRHHSDVVRGQLSDGFLKSGEFKGILYVFLQNLMLNWITKPDFIAYNHRYADVCARKICRSLYKNMAVAWTIKSQQELEKARNKFDIFIFDSFIPDGK